MNYSRKTPVQLLSVKLLVCLSALLALTLFGRYAYAQISAAGQTGSVNTTGTTFTNNDTGRIHSVQRTSAEAQSAADAIAGATGGIGKTFRLVDTGTGRTVGYIAVTTPAQTAGGSGRSPDDTHVDMTIRNSDGSGRRRVICSNCRRHIGTLTIAATDTFNSRLYGARRCSTDHVYGTHSNFGNDVVAPGESKTFSLQCSHRRTGILTGTVVKLPDASVDLSVRTGSNPTWLNDAGFTVVNIDTSAVAETADLQWTAGGTADECTGRNFSTGPSSPISGTVTNITLPAPGESLNYDITCTAPSGSIAVDSVRINNTAPVVPRPPTNLTVQGFTVTSATGFDSVTGIYSSVTISGRVTNVGEDSTAASEYRLDLNTTGVTNTGTTPALAFGATELASATYTDVQFGTLSLTLEADTANTVAESNESDNTITSSVALPPPTPNMTLTTPQSVINGSSALIEWDTDASYSMSCTVAGAGITPVTFNPSVDGTTGRVTAVGLTSAGLYELRCTEPVSGAVFVEALSIEVIGAVQEI